MAGLAGDDPFGFDFEYDGDNHEFFYNPFGDYGDDGDEGDELIDGPFAVDGDGKEFCVSGFAFPDGEDVLVDEDHASPCSHDELLPETLGRSFDSDSDDGLSLFLPHLVSALNLAGHTSDEEDDGLAGDDRDRGGFARSGFELERRPVIEEAADDDDGVDGLGLGLMLSGFNLDPRPVVGGFQTLVDADEVTGDDDMDEGGGLMLSGFDLGSPQVARTFRMVVGAEDTGSDADDFNLLEVLAGRVGEAARRLPASRAVVEGLPEVVLSEEEASHGCAVCKDGIAAGESVVRLPCKHYFHGECIRPWLAIRNTCPVCRFELPTGDAEYDRRRSRAGVASVARQGVPVQTRGAGAGSGTAMGTGDATECSGESRLEQGVS